MRRPLLTVVASLLAAGSPALAAGRAGSPTAAGGPVSCAWQLEIAPDSVNALYPDTGARYWVTELPAVPGETLTVAGRYPHARYLSYNSYDPFLEEADALDDQAIAPDPGSSNPFLPGASRTVSARSYHLTVVYGQPPADPPPNTLYTSGAGGAHTGRMFTVIYRVYRPDRGRDETGGVGLPTVSVDLPGQRPHLLPDCPYGAEPSQQKLNNLVDDASPDWPRLVALSGLNPPVWYKYYNAATAAARVFLQNQITGTTLSDAVTPYTMSELPSGGLANNADNAYIYTVTNVRFGPALLIRAKLPTFVATYQGQPTMGAGQVRYWSLCTYEPRSQRVIDCLIDDQVVTDSAGFFTLVVTAAADRPANATARCGLNWLDAGPAESTILIMRNMLAAPGFANSVQRAGYGHEQQDLGPYYPVTRYTSVTGVQALGCH